MSNLGFENKLILGLFGVIFIIILLVFGLKLTSGFYKDYSEGSRAGTINKFSKKGFVFKTYEGEIWLGNTIGDKGAVIQNIFRFSLPENSDKDLIKKIEDANTNGGRVKLTYSQWLISPYRFGDSGYSVKSIDESK